MSNAVPSGASAILAYLQNQNMPFWHKNLTMNMEDVDIKHEKQSFMCTSVPIKTTKTGFMCIIKGMTLANHHIFSLFEDSISLLC